MIITYVKAYCLGRAALEEKGVSDPEIDAMLLLEYACSITRDRYYLYMNGEMSPVDEARYREAIDKRARRIPLQQITGEMYFCTLKIKVRENVLIPRRDTEILVEEALRCARKGPDAGNRILAVRETSAGEEIHAENDTRAEKGKYERIGTRVLDLCTGSGCVLISMIKLGDCVTGIGTDISNDALELARVNAVLNGVNAEFVYSDLFGEQGEISDLKKRGCADGRYDMIVSNPPYIPSGEIPYLMEEVRDHEPWAALDGGVDGLKFYRRILEVADSTLKRGGWLLAEIGYNQGDYVRSMFVDYGYEHVDVIPDLNGNDRVVEGRRKMA